MEKEEKEVTYTSGKNAIVHVKRKDDPAIPWIRSSEKLLTESPQGTDYALQLYLHWSRGKLVLNVDLEQIETNFSFIVSLCNLYRTFRIWDTSTITCLITVHRKKAPVMVGCIVKTPVMLVASEQLWKSEEKKFISNQYSREKTTEAVSRTI